MAEHDEDDLTPEEARRDHREMLRFLALNAGFGAMLGLLVTGALLALDLGGIATRLARARDPLLPIAMLAVPLAAMFAAAVTASAIMLMPYAKKKARGMR